MTEPKEDKTKDETGNSGAISKPKSESWYNKYLEKIIAAAITVILVGIVSWTFSNFATKIQHIEKNIVAHHGPQWETIEKVVAIGKLREEFLKAKQDYASKLKDLELTLSFKEKVLQQTLSDNSSLLVALEKWSEQVDKAVKASREREYEAYAHLTTHASDSADVALLNTAHIGGTRFNTGDKIVLTNTSSGRREKTTVKIISAYTDLENTDVLVQVAKQPAAILGLSKTLGRIKVIVKKETPDPDDPRRWKPISEIMKKKP